MAGYVTAGGDAPIVLVTGATGFIGTALVERLVAQGQAVRALARSLSKAPRIARFGVELVVGDVGDPQALSRALEGCDSVVHCAYDFASPESNVSAARTLADLAAVAGVRRVVHLSTISVHEPLPAGGVVDERTPFPDTEFPYTLAKRSIEGVFDQAASEGLSVTMLRPTIVYGPYSAAWTDGVAKMLRTSRILVPNAGRGICNPVYIDDVVEAISLALWAERAAPHPLLITGPDWVTWGEFFNAYEAALGTSSVVLGDPVVPRTASPKPSIARVPNPMRVLKGPALSAVRASLQERLGATRTDAIKRSLSRLVASPEEPLASLYAAGASISYDAAKQHLGFHPQVAFEQGMGRTAQYMHWANL